MNCPDVTERLPWLLNETLPAAERAEVLSHLEDCAACRGELQQVAGMLEEIEQHPAVERLIAYVYGEEMEPPERGSIERHLAVCRRCAAETELARHSRRAMPSRPFLSMRFIGIAAALLAFVAGGLLMKAWQSAMERESVLEARVRALEDRIARFGQPSASGQVVDLLPLQSRQRAAAGARVPIAAGGTVETTFLLNSRIPDRAAGCTIRLSSAGRELWVTKEVLRGANGEFLVRVPAGFLHAGTHRLAILCEGAEEQYEFVIE